MEGNGQNSSSEHMTQKDIVQLLLHNAQHMVTREELKSDINEVKDEIVKVETSLKQDMVKLESSLKQDMVKLEASLKQDMVKLESSLRQDISKIDAKFDKIQWLIIATMLTILLKDSVLRLLE
jgi:predicted  nucleic acid-binding Zn-ribbon protein